MPAKKRASSADISRLKVLAAGEQAPFLEHASALLTSGHRLAREAALETLAERPLAQMRPLLRQLYDELDTDGSKLDQGAAQRVNIVRALRTIGDVRDAEIGVRASETREVAFGEDVAWNLRAHGLMMLAELDPEKFPYYAAEHLSDVAGVDGEPANTAFQLLAGTGQYALIYEWLITTGAEAAHMPAVFELFTKAPAPIVRRFVAGAVESAVRRNDEAMCTLLAETIVNLELEDAYPQIAAMMSAKISEELYGYLAMLLCGTNRKPLLAIIEEQLIRGRRPKAIVAALNVRVTPEQAAILKRWEERD